MRESVTLACRMLNQADFWRRDGRVGEGIFFAGLKHVAIKVVASYTEDQIITSDPSQLLQIKEMKKELTETKTI